MGLPVGWMGQWLERRRRGRDEQGQGWPRNGRAPGTVNGTNLGAPSQDLDLSKGIAVVVPVLNERELIGNRLEALCRSGFAEIIVVDGGSRDGTPDIVSGYPQVRLVRSAPGRGRQINAGVEEAVAPYVVVLHADTQLPEGAAAHIRRTLGEASVACGCFRLSFDEASAILRFSAWMSRFETYWTTFGDQAFFFRRIDFELIGGAPDWPLFEDVELRRRFRRIGSFRKLGLRVVTSARRFRAHGHLRTQLANMVLLTGHGLGISPERLARLYRR